MSQISRLTIYTLNGIWQQDNLMGRFIENVKSLPYPSDRVPVVVFANRPMCWRRAMYYLPNHNVYFLEYDISSDNIIDAKIGYKHSHSNLNPLTRISFGSKADCIVWIVNPRTLLYLRLQDQLSLRPFSDLPPGFYVSEPPERIVDLGGIGESP